MRITLDHLAEFRAQLETILDKESKNLWRLARIARKHNCSNKLIEEITQEGWKLYEMMNNPEKVLNWNFEYETKYAFR